MKWIAITVLLLMPSGLAAERPNSTMQIEDVAFSARCDQTEQHYMVIRPPGTPRDALIALHGHGSDRHQFVEDQRDECRAAREVAARHGMVLVSPDYRARTSWMGPKAEADMVQIIEELHAKEGIQRVFLCGGSMGGTGALTFAALHPDLLAGVASMNGTANLVEYENFLDAISESYGGTKAEVPEEYRKRSAEFFPERFTMPLGITAGGKDELVPPQSVLRLAEKVKSLGHEVLVVYRADGGHETNFEDGCRILEYVIARAALKQTR